MLLTLTRDTFTTTSTTGIMTLDGLFFSYVLEDRDRGLTSAMTAAEIAAIKVKGRTCIPYGRWPIRVTWSPKFNEERAEVICAGFHGIRIHAGNDAEDTEGCLLPGKSRARNRVYYTTAYAAWINGRIREAIGRGEDVWLDVRKA